MSAEDVWGDIRALVFDHADPHRAVVAATGESFYRCKVLRRLVAGPLSAGALAERLNTDPPYLSVTLKELESRGYVIRTEDLADRRRRVVELTDSGREMADRANTALNAPPAEFAKLSADELGQLETLMGRLLRS